MPHDLVHRYRRMVTRLEDKLVQAVAAGDSTIIAAATDDAAAARAALAAMEQDAGTIAWANVLDGTSSYVRPRMRAQDGIRDAAGDRRRVTPRGRSRSA